MKLSRYLEITGKTKREFAEAAELPLSTVYRLLEDKSMWPSHKTAKAIAKATDGAVTANDFVGEEIEKPAPGPSAASEPA